MVAEMMVMLKNKKDKHKHSSILAKGDAEVVQA